MPVTIFTPGQPPTVAEVGVSADIDKLAMLLLGIKDAKNKEELTKNNYELGIRQLDDNRESSIRSLVYQIHGMATTNAQSNLETNRLAITNSILDVATGKIPEQDIPGILNAISERHELTGETMISFANQVSDIAKKYATGEVDIELYKQMLANTYYRILKGPTVQNEYNKLAKTLGSQGNPIPTVNTPTYSQFSVLPTSSDIVAGPDKISKKIYKFELKAGE